jgi:hypothetical protein
VLSRRLIASTGAVLLLGGCAGADGTERGALRENVIEPGITAIDQSRVMACGSEASSFRTSLEAYELLEGVPALDEDALIDSGLQRSESELWDVVDGQLVAQDPACGQVPTTVEATEIVTESDIGQAPTVDEILADFTDQQVELVGGDECARQLAVVTAGAGRFVAERGVDPATIDDVERAGYFVEPVTMWDVVDGQLRPAPGSPCPDFVAVAGDDG